jgi:hypothetical protein
MDIQGSKDVTHENDTTHHSSQRIWKYFSVESMQISSDSIANDIEGVEENIVCQDHF